MIMLISIIMQIKKKPPAEFLHTLRKFQLGDHMNSKKYLSQLDTWIHWQLQFSAFGDIIIIVVS